MARVTVEDCVVKVPNRFELVLVASNRAKSLASGSPVAIEGGKDGEKDTVIALREIADDAVNIESIKSNIYHNIENNTVLDYNEVIDGKVEESRKNKIADAEKMLFADDNVNVDD